MTTDELLRRAREWMLADPDNKTEDAWFVIRDLAAALRAERGWHETSSEKWRVAVGEAVSRAERAEAALAVFDGSSCAEDMAAGDGPCGVCVTCLKRERDEARALLRESRDALWHYEVKDVLVDRIDAALGENDV